MPRWLLFLWYLLIKASCSSESLISFKISMHLINLKVPGWEKYFVYTSCIILDISSVVKTAVNRLSGTNFLNISIKFASQYS